jgi:hypothetical protein
MGICGDKMMMIKDEWEMESGLERMRKIVKISIGINGTGGGTNRTSNQLFHLPAQSYKARIPIFP